MCRQRLKSLHFPAKRIVKSKGHSQTVDENQRKNKRLRASVINSKFGNELRV
jgi:hypothetical protein